MDTFMWVLIPQQSIRFFNQVIIHHLRNEKCFLTGMYFNLPADFLRYPDYSAGIFI